MIHYVHDHDHDHVHESFLHGYVHYVHNCSFRQSRGTNTTDDQADAFTIAFTFTPCDTPRGSLRLTCHAFFIFSVNKNMVSKIIMVILRTHSIVIAVHHLNHHEINLTFAYIIHGRSGLGVAMIGI